MTLRLCLNCAVIYECPPDVAKICPRCNGLLELREQVKEDGVRAFVEICSEAAHGPVSGVGARWSIK